MHDASHASLCMCVYLFSLIIFILIESVMLVILYRFVQEKGKHLFWLMMVLFMVLAGWDLVALGFQIGVFLIK